MAWTGSAVLLLATLSVAAVAAVADSTGAVAAAAPAAKSVGWMSLLPPALAIALALLTRQVLLSLLLGVWVGAWVLAGDPATAFLRVGDRFLIGALADRSHAAIILFSTILGGMVGVLSRSGATEGIVHWLGGRVGGRRGAQAATSAMGTIIFFDDYANTLLVGSTMRPLTDRLRVSREKLAWLVDSTAAPVTTVAVISAWVEFEVGLIQDAMTQLGQGGEAYTFFLQSIPYSFYPLLTILLVYLVPLTGRDWGPMLKAERRALTTGQVIRPGARPASDQPVAASTVSGRPAHPLLAGLPILAVLLVTALGLYFDGRAKAVVAGNASPTLREVLNLADSFSVLMWAALSGAVLAIGLMVGTRRQSLGAAFDSFIDGAKSMVIAVCILILAWSLSAVCTALGTADFLVEASRGVLSARLLPLVTFVLAGAISFATGTSWGTMAILMPLVYPLGAHLPADSHLAPGLAAGIHLAAVSAVLAGSVFGDHCSPVSDTTIMSSLASGSDHIDHVKTQLPYALLVAGISGVCGYLPVGLGLSPWVSLALGAGVLIVVWLRLGKRVVETEKP